MKHNPMVVPSPPLLLLLLLPRFRTFRVDQIHGLGLEVKVEPIYVRCCVVVGVPERLKRTLKGSKTSRERRSFLLLFSLHSTLSISILGLTFSVGWVVSPLKMVGRMEIPVPRFRTRRYACDTYSSMLNEIDSG